MYLIFEYERQGPAPRHGPGPLVRVFPAPRAGRVPVRPWPKPQPRWVFCRERDPRPMGRLSRSGQSTHLGGEPEWEVLMRQTSQSD